MHAVSRTMTSLSVVKVTVIYVIVGAVLHASQLSAAFRVYDVEELPVFEKRAVEMEPSAIDSLYADSFYISDIGSKAMSREPDQFYTSLPDEDDEDDDEEEEENTDEGDNDSDTDDFTLTPITTRRKRYTEYQDNSLSICAGACMYQRRTTYSDCFDMCNWNGRTTSPWKKFDKQYQEEQQQQQQQASYASRVLTHRFGQRKDHQTTTTTTASSPVAESTQGQGRGKIAIKPIRPIAAKPTIGKSRTPPNNTNKPAENRKKQKTTIEKSEKSDTGKGGKASGFTGKCTR